MTKRQLSLFPQEPAPLQRLHDWLVDEGNGEKLERLLRELDSVEPKRSYSRYRVKNPDGSVYDRSKRATPQRKSR
jgi:hypothetical protein